MSLARYASQKARVLVIFLMIQDKNKKYNDLK